MTKKSRLEPASPWKWLSIPLVLFFTSPPAMATSQKQTVMALQMSGGNGCAKTESVAISHVNGDEIEITVPNIKISAQQPTTQSKSCRLSLKLEHAHNRQFAVVGASFRLKTNIEEGSNARVTLETYAQGIDPETKTNLVLTGPNALNEVVSTKHEPKWSLCSGNRLFNTGLSLRMGKVGGGPAVGASQVEVSGPIRLKLLWRDC